MSDQKIKLNPERHPNKDFFVADVFDNLPIKDDMASMEHPFFTLSKKRDLREFTYKKDNVSITIKPSVRGLPTIFDKDILLYCCSILMNEINKGVIPPKTLRVSSHDLLVATNRPKGGKGYEKLREALDRLRGVTITTDIETNNKRVTHGFGLIDSYGILESHHYKGRMVGLEITLSDWFYNSILGREVLTINREYFRLGKPMERRLYEIARKHCGAHESWQIGLEKLMIKTGSSGTLKKFRFMIRQLIESNHLPDYKIALNERDIVTFTNRAPQSNVRLSLKEDTIARAQNLVLEANTGWDFDYLERTFLEQLEAGFEPEKVDGAFINFVKKKISAPPE